MPVPNKAYNGLTWTECQPLLLIISCIVESRPADQLSTGKDAAVTAYALSSSAPIATPHVSRLPLVVVAYLRHDFSFLSEYTAHVMS